MTKIANNSVAKLAVAFTTVAMLFTLVAPAQAQSVEDLQAQIEALLAQISGLQGGGATMSSSDVCPYNWSRNLNMGATGMDVMKLQQFLNADPATQVSVSGAGAPGMETEYYGPATGAAVMKFQELNRDAILTPVGLVSGTTFFGPSTRAEANAQCVAAPVVEEEEEEATEEEEEEETSSTKTLGDDEGSIESIDRVSADESNLEEGKTQGLFAFTAEIEGDVEIDRLDVYLDSTAAGTQSDNADDYFVAAYLWVDGEEVAELDVDEWDEDEYGNVSVVTGDDDEYRLRFSGLGLVFEDGDEPEFQIALEAIGNIDGDDEDETWGFDNPDFRFVDGQGFTDNESDDSVQEDFSFDEEETAELDITKSSDSEDEKTVEVDTDDTSAEFPIMIIEIEEENDVAVVIEEMTMTASTTNGDVTTTIDEVLLYVDGEEIGSDTPSATGALTFEDLALEIGGEETVEVAVHVVFNGTEDYAEGDEVFVTFNAVTEAKDDNGNDEGDITGANPTDFSSDTFTLRSEGIGIVLDSVDEDKDAASFSGDTDTGTFTFVIEVTAFGDDFYIDEATDVVNYTLLVDGSSAPAASSTPAITISGADDASTSDYKISRGDTVTITYTVETAASVSGSTRVRIDSVDYSAADDGSEELNETATPASDWRSDTLILN